MFGKKLKILKASLKLKCPKCKEGNICKSRFEIETQCACCGLVYKKIEEGWAGPATINYGLTLFLTVLFFLMIYPLGMFGSTGLTIILAVFALFVSGLIYAYVNSFWIHFLFDKQYLK